MTSKAKATTETTKKTTKEAAEAKTKTAAKKAAKTSTKTVAKTPAKTKVSDKKLLEQIAQQKIILDHFIKAFSSAYMIDLANDTFEVLQMKHDFSEAFSMDGGRKEMEKFISEHVNIEDRQLMFQMSNKDYVRHRLLKDSEITFLVREEFGSVERTMRGIIMRGTDADHVAVGFMDVTEEMEKEKQNRRKIERNLEIIDILASEYSSVYYIDLIKDELDPYTMNEKTEFAFGTMFRNGIKYSEAFRMYVDSLVQENDKLRMLKAGSIYNILKELYNKKSYITTYKNSEGRYCEMKFVKVGDSENPRAVALAFADKDDEIRAEMVRNEIQERDRAVIAGLSDDFGCVVYVSYDNLSEVHYRFDPLFEKHIDGWTMINNFNERREKLISTIVHPDDRESFKEATKVEVVRDMLDEYGVYFVNFRLRIDDEISYYQAKFVKDDKHYDSHFIAGFHNVDAETKREMEALKKAESANKAKTDFLFNMSHDIRTPMNAIMGFTDIAIKNIKNKDKVIDSLHKTQEAGELLLNLINSILDMSRIESGKAKMEENKGDVYLSFANIESTLQELATARNITLTFDVVNIIDRYVYCDFNRCTRIFVNLITNAIKYTKEGGCVKVQCEQIQSNRKGYGMYRYTFEDNGIGMSEEFQTHVFEEFAREENSTTSGIQGTGLGLSVCKSFVTLLGGTIECISRQGVGTKFIVTLPFRIQDKNEYTHPDTGDVLTQDEDVIEDTDVDLKGLKILLAEDNELNREIARNILESEGMIVDEAKDGTVAVNCLREKGAKYYDCILMGIQMPIMNGFEAATVIRNMYPTAKFPIIALSANAFAEDKVAAITAGMNDHVAKPINSKELYAAIAKHISKKDNKRGSKKG